MAHVSMYSTDSSWQNVEENRSNSKTNTNLSLPALLQNADGPDHDVAR